MNEQYLTGNQESSSGLSDAERPARLPASLIEMSLPFWITAVIIIIDHATKLVIESRLPLYHSWTPFPELPFIRITHVTNTGAAFGLFPDANPVFMTVAIIVSLVIVVYNYHLPGRHTLLRLALGLQLGGALGNLIDRFRLGHVTDFVDVGPWPVFNVADASIVAGVTILAYLMWREHRREPKEAGEEEQGVMDVRVGDEG